MHPAPPSSIHLHPAHFNLQPAPPSSIHLHPAHFSLHPAFCNTLNNIWTKILHVNWAISPNLGRKIKSRPFWLKIGTYGEVLIPNLDLELWNSEPKIHYWANLNPKIQSCLFCLKISASSISKMLIPNPDIDFWNFDAKIHFWANLSPKIQSCPFCLKIGAHSISRMLVPNPDLDFWNFDLKTHSWGKFWPKKSSVLFENWYTWYLKHADSYFNISFLNFKS